MNPSVPSLQHYVPRFLLKQFGTGKKDYVWVFDKHRQKAFQVSARKIAAEHGFYDFSFMGETLSIEEGLSKLETLAAKVLADVIDNRTLAELDATSKGVLAEFFAVQMVRTRASREQYIHLGEELKRLLEGHPVQQTFFEHDAHFASAAEQEKAEISRMVVNAGKTYGPQFFSKDWLLFGTDRKAPFMIGDHPLVLHNDLDLRPYGNLGLSVKGIQLYFPLNPTLALAMWCPSHRQQIEDGIERLRQLGPTAANLGPNFGASLWALKSAFDSGAPARSTPDNVTHFNSLQIAHAARFVISESSQFELVKEMLRRNPELRSGRKVEVN
ncbi:MAG TPA: DUF4238 domain-containing protein [Solimonas sp.]|nr:DUF4238 domain-containing protein [Solimonas sp.]